MNEQEWDLDDKNVSEGAMMRFNGEKTVWFKHIPCTHTYTEPTDGATNCSDLPCEKCGYKVEIKVTYNDETRS